nr:hypothetical protein [uncultured Dyadobacter sp.]
MTTRKNQARARQTFQDARAQEAEGNADAAIKLYEKAIVLNRLFAQAYNRLLILLRKKKNYKKELDIIIQAVKAHEQHLIEEVQEWEGKNQKSAQLSRALAKSLGLLSAKGVPQYEDRQVSAWKKRMELIKKKLHP